METRIIRDALKNGVTFKSEVAKRDYTDWVKQNQTIMLVMLIVFFVLGALLGYYAGMEATAESFRRGLVSGATRGMIQ